MFGFAAPAASRDAVATLAALDKSQAVIEFDMDGKILRANPNFLTLLGYTWPEIQGHHHSMFVEPAYRASPEYADFWAKLRRGEAQVAQFKRIGKNGREIWIEASYNPVAGSDGKPFKVAKYATDVTRQKQDYADLLGQVTAINKSQAVIEFGLDGIVRTANRNFLDLMGYTLAEVQGQHHGMFVEPAYRASADYRQFWERLNQGEYQAAQFKRLGKGGKVVWIEASYNPILDLNGKPAKVVKYATDITRQVEMLANLKSLIDRNFAEIDTAIERSAGQTQQASTAAGETSGNVQRMAASAEELAAAAREIADTMAKSRAATDTARARTTAADEATQRLATASRSMEGIIDLIRSIAGQINLLALNATIESARAGDAGKGFAVVASEVKNLAQQASNATDQISREIAGLQEVSNEVVTALATIEKSIDAVREYVTGTASAVEQQSAVMQDMSANMQTTASHVVAINDNMTEIAAAVHQAAQAVSTTKTAAQVLVR